jgi:hypothetical protein
MRGCGCGYGAWEYACEWRKLVCGVWCVLSVARCAPRVACCVCALRVCDLVRVLWWTVLFTSTLSNHARVNNSHPPNNQTINLHQSTTKLHVHTLPNSHTIHPTQQAAHQPRTRPPRNRIALIRIKTKKVTSRRFEHTNRARSGNLVRKTDVKGATTSPEGTQSAKRCWFLLPLLLAALHSSPSIYRSSRREGRCSSIAAWVVSPSCNRILLPSGSRSLAPSRLRLRWW